MDRRNFTRMVATGAASVIAPVGWPGKAGTYPAAPVGIPGQSRAPKSQSQGKTIPVGLCDWSLHRWGWDAEQYLDFAIEHGLDAMLFNSFGCFSSLEEEYLVSYRERAGSHGILIHVGVGSIINERSRFMKQYGNPDALVSQGIRVARLLGSPVLTCRIGNINDRYSEGGIGPKIEKSVRILKAHRQEALDAGIRFAFENHAGDLRADELIGLIQETGTDVCGALFDPSNAVWAMEDPSESARQLGSLIISTSVRDFMVWETAEGAAFQNVNIGSGLMDYSFLIGHMSAHCPGVPLHIETVSGGAREIPFLQPDYWEGFPDLKAKNMAGFLRLAKRGHELAVPQPGKDDDDEKFMKDKQRTDFLSSLEALRNLINQ